MHPTYTSDRPGDCPICNMKLVKREPVQQVPASAGEHVHDAGSPRAFTVDEIMSMKPGEVCLLHKCNMGICTVAMTEEFARLGKCPMCGEDLGVIVKDVVPQGYAKISLPPEKQQWP